MLFETAIGDAYGLGWEFAPQQQAVNDLSAFRQNPKYDKLLPGRYSDDTMRSIANAAVILTGPQAWYDPAAYVHAYQCIHASDGRDGWSRGFQAYLESNRRSTPQQFMLGLRRRATNGAVMGVSPIGYLPDENSVRLAATIQCISTHAGGAASSAQAIALAAHYLIHGKGPISSLYDYLKDEVDWTSKEECIRVLCLNGSPMPIPEMPAWTIASSALFILTDTGFTGMADRLRWAVDLGGDTDSLGAVAMALCSCAPEITNDLPASLTESLETEGQRLMLRQMDGLLQEFLEKN